MGNIHFFVFSYVHTVKHHRAGSHFKLFFVYLESMWEISIFMRFCLPCIEVGNIHFCVFLSVHGETSPCWVLCFCCNMPFCLPCIEVGNIRFYVFLYAYGETSPWWVSLCVCVCLEQINRTSETSTCWVFY